MRVWVVEPRVKATAYGEKLGVWGTRWYCDDNRCLLNFAQKKINLWFAGKLIEEGTDSLHALGPVYQDRLGTVRSNGGNTPCTSGTARFRPYGEEITSTSNDRTKFGNKAVRAFLQQGYTVYPVNPNE